jgi:hypothetical protein
MTHQTAGVNETTRNLSVAVSLPQPIAQQARSIAGAVVVPFNYSSGQKAGGP